MSDTAGDRFLLGAQRVIDEIRVPSELLLLPVDQTLEEGSSAFGILELLSSVVMIFPSLTARGVL